MQHHTDARRAPRKTFPWALYAQSPGIGHSICPAALEYSTKALPVTGQGPEPGRAVRDLQRKLASYGYGVEITGNFDDVTKAVVTAFQRHFRPARVDGVADPSTQLTLITLMERRQVAAA